MIILTHSCVIVLGLHEGMSVTKAAFKQKSNRQVSIPAKIAYGMGHSLLSVKNMLFHFFFLFFFSNILGVPVLLVGVVTLIPSCRPNTITQL